MVTVQVPPLKSLNLHLQLSFGSAASLWSHFEEGPEHSEGKRNFEFCPFAALSAHFIAQEISLGKASHLLKSHRKLRVRARNGVWDPLPRSWTGCRFEGDSLGLDGWSSSMVPDWQGW